MGRVPTAFVALSGEPPRWNRHSARAAAQTRVSKRTQSPCAFCFLPGVLLFHVLHLSCFIKPLRGGACRGTLPPERGGRLSCLLCPSGWCVVSFRPSWFLVLSVWGAVLSRTFLLAAFPDGAPPACRDLAEFCCVYFESSHFSEFPLFPRVVICSPRLLAAVLLPLALSGLEPWGSSHRSAAGRPPSLLPSPLQLQQREADSLYPARKRLLVPSVFGIRSGGANLGLGGSAPAPRLLPTRRPPAGVPLFSEETRALRPWQSGLSSGGGFDLCSDVAAHTEGSLGCFCPHTCLCHLSA